MPLKPADMTSCTKKAKCLAGPNAGIAYTPGDECTNLNETFDFVSCDCIPPPAECIEYPGIIDDKCSMWRIHGVQANFGIDYYDIRSFGSPLLQCQYNIEELNNKICYEQTAVIIRRYEMSGGEVVLTDLAFAIRLCLSGTQTPTIQALYDIPITDPDYFRCL